MGDEEQETAPRAPKAPSPGPDDTINRPDEPEHKRDELPDLERPRLTARPREQGTSSRPDQEERDNRPAPADGPRPGRPSSRRARGSSSKELEDIIERCLEDKDKDIRNELRNEARDRHVVHEGREREETPFSGLDGHQGK